MSSSRLALVSNHSVLSRMVQDHLVKQQRYPVLETGYDEIRDLVDGETDGLLVLLRESEEDLPVARRLVQDLCLAKTPVVLVVLDALRGDEEKLAELDPYLTRRLRWPEDLPALVQLCRELPRGPEFSPRGAGDLEDLLARKLLAWTPSLLPLVDRIALAADHDVTVLLNGETGTGKTYLARLIHDHSPRRHERFLTIPCGAISANLVESEFFGHVRGAFTGADRPKIGKFAAVGQGTLLLDEIDTLGLEQQATLLRVIETGEFEPVGSVETLQCTGRLIVASNVDLEEAVDRGRFRPDLYFRLNVMSFHLPPLRERVQDIAPLARGMAARFNRKFRKDLFDIHPETLAALEGFSWPGNLRQLENVLQHAVLVSSGPLLLPDHLPAALQEQLQDGREEEGPPRESLHHQRDVIERNVIQRALISNGYSRTRAADSLGISRVTLYKKMKKYGLMKPRGGHAHV